MRRSAIHTRLPILLTALALVACTPATLPDEGPPIVLNRPTATLAQPSPPPTRRILVVPPTRRPTAPPNGTPSPQATDEAWLVEAGLGPYASPVEDLAQIAQRARSEGAVQLYSDSSRALTAVESFAMANPELDVDAYTPGSYDIYLWLLQDIAREEPVADVYLVSDPPRTLALLEQGLLWNHLPQGLREVLPESAAEPLLVHHWSALTWIGPTPSQGQAVVGNWWDLTRPEWRGRVAIPDPQEDDRTLYLLATLSQHGDALAAAYQQAFGRELVLDADCPDAGYQWIKALLQNEPLLTHGDVEVARWVGDPAAEGMRVGLCGLEQYGRVSRGTLSFAPLTQVSPMAGLYWPTYLGIVDQAPHPGAAKLLAHWLMGDAEGGQGYAPWRQVGLYPARTDVPDPAGSIPRTQWEGRLWSADPAYIAEQGEALRAFIRSVRGS
ncbi:MAG: ABC transporter substrate-binding protein [Anaerolineae bacterium]